jgi:NodT family efflux transporter outer membrane factor (OMF) lipoprotein
MALPNQRQCIEKWPRLMVLTAAGVLLTAQSGCVVGPKYEKPQVTVPSAYREQTIQQASDGSQWKSAEPRAEVLRGNWWELYQEPELNALEQELNKSDQNIAKSFANLMAARAQVGQARASYYPTVTLTPSFTRERLSTNSVSGGSGATSTTGSTATRTGSSGISAVPGTSPYANVFDLPLDVSWEPDLWGRIRNTVSQYADAAQVSAADLANERLSEQASLAMYYFELRGQDSLLDFYNKTVDADRQSLELTQTLSNTGINDEQSVIQARVNLKTAEAQATGAQVTRAQYQHAIAVLIGQSASTFSMPRRSLTTAVPSIPIGVPSDLLERRPDIAAAERTMAEANALIGVETAAYYPSLTLSAEGGFQGSTLSNWLTWPSRFFSVGPSVSETLFDGGLRRYTVAQYKAMFEADVASYKQIVLTAFQQIEDYLSAVQILQRQIAQDTEAVEAAQAYLKIAEKRFQLGLDPYTDVFTAQNSLLTDQQTLTNARVQQMTASVQLIEALGGGWTLSQLPSERSMNDETKRDADDR